MKHHDGEIPFAERLKRLSGEQYEKVVVGHEISKLRKARGMTQKELAYKLKTKQSVVARIEAGKQNITVRILVKVAEIFGKNLVVKFRSKKASDDAQ